MIEISLPLEINYPFSAAMLTAMRGNRLGSAVARWSGLK